MIKLLLDKQIFASSVPRFWQDTCNNGSYMQKFVHNFSLDMVLSPFIMCLWSLGGGVEEPQGGTPQYMKKISMSEIDF